MTKNNALLAVTFVVFQTDNQANGGVESITQVIEASEALSPTVITQIDTPVNQRWIKAGACVKIWPISYRKGDSFWHNSFMHKLRWLFSLIQTNYAMWQLVRSTGNKIVHCNDLWALWHTIFGARLAKASVIHNIRDIKPVGDTYGWYWKLIFRLSQCRLVLSKEMKVALQQHFNIAALKTSSSGSARLEVIYSAVDLENMKPFSHVEREELRQQFEISADTVALGYVAAFSPKKAQLTFIEQLGPLLKSLKTVQLYFIGDFEPLHNMYAAKCLEAVERLELEDFIHFVGYTNQVADWYRAIDITILASRQEGLARCMIESLACGTPMISFDVCSACEILEGYSCGLVIPQGDYQALYRAIVSLKEDYANRKKMGQMGRQAACQLFHPQRIVKQYEELYLSLV